MRVVENWGTYLGLSSMFSQGKCKEFKYLVDKVWNIMQGWKSKLFLGGGKEILIKTVTQVIPTYAMSCFHLLKTLMS